MRIPPRMSLTNIPPAHAAAEGKALNDTVKNLLLWMIIAAVLLMVSQTFSQPSQTAQLIYSDFIRDVQAGEVTEVTISGLNIVGRKNSGEVFTTFRPYLEDPKLMDDLLAHNVKVKGSEPEQQSIWTQLLVAS